ncbi:MAG: cobalamin-binding protein [Dehalococcoidia bacterium]
MTWTDALGRSLDLKRPPRRIVSLVPSITETLFALGLEKQIAGVTRFCVEPAAGVADKPKVGGTKQVDVATVKALKPDLVIANVEENEKADIDALTEAGLNVFVTFPRTVAGATVMMRTLADMTGKTAALAPIVSNIQAQAALARGRDRDRRPIRVFCPIWRNPWMTIGPDTYIHDFLATCSAENVYGDAKERYPKIELADVAARQPDVVILPDEPYKFSRKHIAEVAAAIPRVPESRIYLMDGKDICWYGPRIAEGLRHVRHVLWDESSL